jgi:hypothetical protein
MTRRTSRKSVRKNSRRRSSLGRNGERDEIAKMVEHAYECGAYYAANNVPDGAYQPDVIEMGAQDLLFDDARQFDRDSLQVIGRVLTWQEKDLVVAGFRAKIASEKRGMDEVAKESAKQQAEYDRINKRHERKARARLKGFSP